MKNKIILFIILILLVICGCSNKENPRLKEILDKNNYIVVDVRTTEEYNTSHVVNSINIPYDEIKSNINLDKEKMILVYCESGTRSKIAYDMLKGLGYKVYDLGAYDEINLDKE